MGSLAEDDARLGTAGLSRHSVSAVTDLQAASGFSWGPLA